VALAQGDTAVYSKTGTVGRVVRIMELDGKTWAELDSTGLFYEINSLEPVAATGAGEERKPTGVKEPKKKVKREKVAVEKGVEDMKDEGSLDSSAGVCGAG
jgi:hypothetical protein